VDLQLLRRSHATIARVSESIEGNFRMHTAIASIMELVNECSRARESASVQAQSFALATAASLLFPFAPHCSADVYERLTGARVWEQPWPVPDRALLDRDEIEILVQVNGKLRDKLRVAPDASGEELKQLALSSSQVRAHIDGLKIVKEVIIPGKLVNFVAR
jgi:leucyl-tRNA synthetase